MKKHRIRVAILKRLSLHNIPVGLEDLIDSNEIIDEIGHLPLSNDEKLFVKQQVDELLEFGYIREVVGYDEVYTLESNIAAKIQQCDQKRILPDDEFLWGVRAYMCKK